MKGSLSERSDLNSIHVIAEEVYLDDYQQKHSKQLVTQLNLSKVQFAQQTRFKGQPSPMKQNAYVSKGYVEMSSEMQFYSNNESLEVRESSFDYVEEQRTN